MRPLPSLISVTLLISFFSSPLRKTKDSSRSPDKGAEDRKALRAQRTRRKTRKIINHRLSQTNTEKRKNKEIRNKKQLFYPQTKDKEKDNRTLPGLESAEDRDKILDTDKKK